MDNGKLDNQLNLALSMTEEERERTLDLDVGFEAETNTWELIVKYSGSLDRIAEELDADIAELLNEYAIIVIQQDKIAALSQYDEIEFIEKPRRLFYEVSEAVAASCIPPLQTFAFGLTGKGVLAGIVDSGIDFSHPDFRNPDGTTRIIALWDQALDRIFYSDEINAALAVRNPAERLSLIPSNDLSGHGTAVAGIFCGNGRASDGRNRGVAYESDMIIVKLGVSIRASFPRSTQLMEAVDFCIRQAIGLSKPISINLSFGNNYGGHDGNTLLESYLSEMANLGKTCIVTGTGNEGSAGHHASGILREREDRFVEFAVAAGEASLNLQIWKNYYDNIDFILTAPSGASYGPIMNTPGTKRFILDSVEVFLFYGEPQPYNQAQEIYFEFIPTGNNSIITSGIWRVTLLPRKIITGNYSLWLPTGELILPQTRFLLASETTTLTIPSTAYRLISTAAYDSSTDGLAYFSGRGFTRDDRSIKPDIAAPGVNILTTTPGGGYSRRTGTSFASPFAAGSCALLMQWGIVDGNDPYLYGEKVKAYLIAGARHLAVLQNYPNPELGFGALCLKDSLTF